MTTGDVDIDVFDRETFLSLFEHVPAMVERNGEPTMHNSGIYLQNIPRDPITGLAVFDYARAEELGYFKIDVLTASVYEGVRDEAHLVELMCRKPKWQLIHTPRFLLDKQIWQIAQHGDLAAAMRPASIDQLAMLLAVIRPAKRHLQRLSWSDVAEDVGKGRAMST